MKWKMHWKFEYFFHFLKIIFRWEKIILKIIMLYIFIKFYKYKKLFIEISLKKCSWMIWI